MLEISLIEVLPGIIHACELAKITPHTTVLITGQGVSGLVMTQVGVLSPLIRTALAARSHRLPVMSPVHSCRRSLRSILQRSLQLQTSSRVTSSWLGGQLCVAYSLLASLLLRVRAP
jgi:hypothetical protein